MPVVHNDAVEAPERTAEEIMQMMGDGESDAVEISERMIKDLCGLFRLLADGPRLRILLQLARTGEMNVTELCEWLQESQPAVSYHLRLMHMSGIIQMRAEGRLHYYSVRLVPFQKIMSVLTREKGGINPCDCFLECVLGSRGARL